MTNAAGTSAARPAPAHGSTRPAGRSCPGDVPTGDGAAMAPAAAAPTLGCHWSSFLSGRPAQPAARATPDAARTRPATCRFRDHSRVLTTSARQDPTRTVRTRIYGARQQDTPACSQRCKIKSRFAVGKHPTNKASSTAPEYSNCGTPDGPRPTSTPQPTCTPGLTSHDCHEFTPKRSTSSRHVAAL